MEVFYDSLSFLPEFIQRPTVTLLVIIIGYFLSKVMVALVGVMLPNTFPITETTDNDVLTFRMRVIRSCFWVSWLVFIIIGLNQLPVTASAMEQWFVKPRKLMPLLLIVFGTVVLIINDKLVLKAGSILNDIVVRLTPKKTYTLVNYGLCMVGLILFAICGLALGKPESAGLKIIATLLLVVFGNFLGRVFRTTVSSIIGIPDRRQALLPKCFFYFVWVTFILEGFYLWL